MCTCVRAKRRTSLSVVLGSGVGRRVPTFVVTGEATSKRGLVHVREGSGAPSLRACRPFRRSGSVPRIATTKGTVIGAVGLTSDGDGVRSRRSVIVSTLVVGSSFRSVVSLGSVESVIDVVRSVK